MLTGPLPADMAAGLSCSPSLRAVEQNPDLDKRCPIPYLQWNRLIVNMMHKLKVGKRGDDMYLVIVMGV